MFVAIGDNISLGDDPLSVLWNNYNIKVRLERENADPGAVLPFFRSDQYRHMPHQSIAIGEPGPGHVHTKIWDTMLNIACRLVLIPNQPTVLAASIDHRPCETK